MQRLDLGPVFRGDTWYWQFTVLQPDRTTPQDITGAAFRFTAKDDLADADVEATVSGTTAGGECQVTDAANGLVTVKIDPAQTAGVSAPAVLEYDLQARDGAGDVWTVARGRLSVDEDVSLTAP